MTDAITKLMDEDYDTISRLTRELQAATERAEKAEAQVGQLWLEAAEIVQDLAQYEIDVIAQTSLKAVAGVLRAKAESTPKPSPALPREEK